MNNITQVLHEDCVGCEACRGICPVGAITMAADAKGFAHPVIDSAACIDCGKCTRACPALHQSFNETEPFVFALTLRDEEAKYRSSSGGAFYWLASEIIGRGGTVYGAAFDADAQRVKHIRAACAYDLRRLQNSKYVQSAMGDCYLDAKRDLEDGGLVLFSGTPCQIAGLYAFLGKRYDKLYTCDILCYGVPSPMVFEKYLRETAEGDAAAVNMREKHFGWVGYSMYIESGKGVYRKEKTKDPYQLGFQTNLFYRDCCFRCQFRKTSRVGDFTLGDFWLFKESFKKNSLRNNDTGISFFMMNNDRAAALVKRMDQSQIFCERRRLEENVRNFGFGKEMEVPEAREDFFRALETKPYSEAIAPYIHPDAGRTSLARKAYRTLKKSYLVRKLLHRLGVPV